MKRLLRILLISTLVITGLQVTIAQEKKALTVTDMMKFRHIKSPSISNNGEWVVHTSKPDRGDPEVFVYSTDGKKEFIIPFGESPVISADGRWVAAVKTVPAEVALQSKPGKGKDTPEAGMSVLNTSTGEITVVENVSRFRFSNDGKWLVYHSSDEPAPTGKEGKKEKSPSNNDAGNNTGKQLFLMSLTDGNLDSISFVKYFTIDSTSTYMAYTLADTAVEKNGTYLLKLNKGISEITVLYADSNAWGDGFAWNNRKQQLAFVGGRTDKKNKKGDADLYLWSPGDAKAEVILSDSDLEDGNKVYHKNNLRFSRDGKRLFLGTKPESEIIEPEQKEDTLADIFDTEKILSERGVDVWHWNDPYINTQQKKMWSRVKDRTYTGVYHLGSGKFVQLADPDMTDIRISECKDKVLGSTNVPYAQRVTWEGRISDYYVVDLETGERTLALKEHSQSVSMSPDGNYLVFFHDSHWYVMETGSLKKRNLTKSLDVPFADEDWDYPADVPGYGVAGWMSDSRSVLIYDKFDIWQFPLMSGDPVCLTEGKGRQQMLQFRIRRLEGPGGFGGFGGFGFGSSEPLKQDEQVFLSAYHDLKKYTGLYSMKAGRKGITKLVEEPRKYTFIAKAKDSKEILYSRETYTEYPDLWVSTTSFRKHRKLSDANPQVSEFAWGEAELVEWSSIDGKPIQGILIKPGNYEPGKKYPVLVYYYRFFTNRLYDFNEVVVNHRPCFPFYASNGYAVFLPDILFDVGNPGYAATKCLVPGVQKIIDMGVADPDAVCLHGHSWSGYQTAFVVTQTDIFACAIAGAPVSNMTSAYSGIRWGSGMARQFQYEKSQSRIGGSLWEARDKYIENSPVFFADRINTPLLIQHGDVDEAVPWYQAIEMYLAMRRLGKDCVFLQYRDEPHHLKKYANKLDYTLKFKAYLDHYLKGEPAPDWIKEGVPYNGK